MAYDKLLAMGFRPGETLLVSGATSDLGSAHPRGGDGDGCPVCRRTGYNLEVFNDLRRCLSERLAPTKDAAVGEEDTARMIAAASGRINAVQDFLRPQ